LPLKYLAAIYLTASVCEMLHLAAGSSV
jgi:hypothetical protein